MTPHDRLATHQTLVRRTMAWAGAIALVLGPPALLWQLVGNPLPEDLPTWAEITSAVTDGGVAERTLLKVLALVCWAAWAQITVALAVETISAVGRRPAPSLPVHRAFRSLGVAIVAGMWLSASTETASATPLPSLPTVDDLVGDLAQVPDEPANGDDEAGADVPPSPGRVDAAVARNLDREYLVRRRDSLWSIAGAELGDPRRWPEILELNRGLPQPDGGHLDDPGDSLRPGWVLRLPVETRSGAIRATVEPGDTLWDLAGEHLGDAARWNKLYDANRSDRGGPVEDPNLILPGWRLTIPENGPSVTTRPNQESTVRPVAGVDTVDIDDIVADAGAADAEARSALDRLRDLAASEGASERASAGATTPDSVARGGGGDASSTDPVAPATVAPSAPGQGAPRGVDDDPLPEPPTVATGAEGPDATWNERGPEGVPRLPAAETWPDRHDSPLLDVDDAEHLSFEVRPGSVTGALAGASIFAAGVAWTLTRLRRAQERWRSAHTPIESAAADSIDADVEVGVRQAADPDLMNFLDLALRAFSQRLREQGRVPPPIVGVNVADELSVLFAERDADAIDGFAAEDDGFSWVIEREAAVPVEATADNPLPALFTFGHTEHSQVLLNPETADSVAVRGAPLDVQAALFTMAVELATGPWAGSLRVVCIGFGAELSGLDHVEVAGTADEVVPFLEEAADAALRMCEVHHVAGSVDARIERVGGDASAPTVVLCAASIGVDDVQRIIEIAHRSHRSGVTAIVAGDHATTWKLDVREQEVTLHPMDVTLARHRLGDDQRNALGRLLEKASRVRALSAAVDPRVVPLPTSPNNVVVDDTPAVEVRVLGPVGVDGRAADFRRRKALELVVYLAMHRGGVEGDVLTEALWPDRFAAPGTLHSTTSLARRCLGNDNSGVPYLPHVAGEGLYRVSDSLSLDYDRFRAYVARARGHDGPDATTRAIADLTSALELVRGRPFAATGTEYLWTHGEALVSAMVAEITDTAHELACLYLDADDHRGAWWATQQGLLASPGNEQLHRDRMLAADLSGNPAGVEDVMEELCRAIEIDGDEVHDVLHPQTLEVYEQLTRRPRSHA